MSAPISIRLDDDMREILEAEAKRREIGLSTLLREIAGNAAKEVRRQRIREQTKAVAEYVSGSPEAQEFFEFWGTPRMEL
jgi:ribbon-helix-helix CopG family protein